jgi:hypothetical protein
VGPPFPELIKGWETTQPQDYVLDCRCLISVEIQRDREVEADIQEVPGKQRLKECNAQNTILHTCGLVTGTK